MVYPSIHTGGTLYAAAVRLQYSSHRFRLPAGGFTHSEFITGRSGGRRSHLVTEADVPDEELYREWIARLEADPPELIVDTAAADRRGGRWFPLEGFDALAELVRQRYTRVDTVDDAPIYRLRPNGPTP